MGKPTGFMEFPRQAAPYRPAKERLLDFNEIYTDHDIQRLSTQSDAAWTVVFLFASPKKAAQFTT